MKLVVLKRFIPDKQKDHENTTLYYVVRKKNKMIKFFSIFSENKEEVEMQLYQVSLEDVSTIVLISNFSSSRDSRMVGVKKIKSM